MVVTKKMDNGCLLVLERQAETEEELGVLAPSSRGWRFNTLWHAEIMDLTYHQLVRVVEIMKTLNAKGKPCKPS